MGEIQKIVRAGVPCIEIVSSISPVGTVLLYHGWSSNISSYEFLGSVISNWGFRVIIPELPYHGERGTIDYFNKDDLAYYFWSIVLQSIEEAQSILIDLFKEDHFVCVMGHSTGGFIASGIYTKNEVVKSAIVINGSCAWVRAEQLFRQKDGRNPMDSQEKETLKIHDPLSNITISRRPLLLLHGSDDTTVSVESQRYFIESLRNRGIYHENTKLIEFSGVNHHITIGMLEQSKDWLIDIVNKNL